MALDLSNTAAVLLAGVGSDDDYVRRAFSAPLRRAGAKLIAHRPRPDQLLAGYQAALDSAASDFGKIIVGGVSIGAAVVAAWALRHPDRTLAVLAALPAWTGSPRDAPAAAAARYSAARLRRDGLSAATAQLHALGPGWLAHELTRSWTAQWPLLPDAMEEAAGYTAPTLAELQLLSAPMGVAVAADDPVHPWQVGADWAAAAPRAALRTVTLNEVGVEPSVLGAACLAALNDAAQF